MKPKPIAELGLLVCLKSLMCRILCRYELMAHRIQRGWFQCVASMHYAVHERSYQDILQAKILDSELTKLVILRNMS